MATVAKTLMNVKVIMEAAQQRQWFSVSTQWDPSTVGSVHQVKWIFWLMKLWKGLSDEDSTHLSLVYGRLKKLKIGFYVKKYHTQSNTVI